MFGRSFVRWFFFQLLCKIFINIKLLAYNIRQMKFDCIFNLCSQQLSQSNLCDWTGRRIQIEKNNLKYWNLHLIGYSIDFLVFTRIQIIGKKRKKEHGSSFYLFKYIDKKKSQIKSTSFISIELVSILNLSKQWIFTSSLKCFIFPIKTIPILQFICVCGCVCVFECCNVPFSFHSICVIFYLPIVFHCKIYSLFAFFFCFLVSVSCPSTTFWSRDNVKVRKTTKRIAEWAKEGSKNHMNMNSILLKLNINNGNCYSSSINCCTIFMFNFSIFIFRLHTFFFAIRFRKANQIQVWRIKKPTQTSERGKRERDREYLFMVSIYVAWT